MEINMECIGKEHLPYFKESLEARIGMLEAQIACLKRVIRQLKEGMDEVEG
jgi:hypothetical protein